jgi:acetyl esterase/lipase
MPYGLLIGVLIVAWGVACALTRWSRLGVAARIPALVVSEMPFAFGYLVTASTILALVQGGLDSPGGVVVAALVAAVLLGLVVIVRRALRAHRVLRNPDPPRRPWGQILRAPLPASRRGIVAVRNLSYGEGPRRTLDVYHRQDRPTGAAVVLHLHGGGFHSGNKSREARPLIGHLTRTGTVCVSANYRLQPQATHANQLADVRDAIEWVRAHIAEYGGDPARLFLVGSSAGAYLAVEAIDQGVTGIAGLVCRYGYYGDLAPRDLPPTLVIHGSNDLMVSAAGARAFAERARSRHPVTYVELPGAHHDFDLYESIRSAAVSVAVESMITRTTRSGAP